MRYTEKLCKEARMVAVKAHGHQDYDGIFPYEKHLDDVVAVLIRFGFDNKFIIAGYLHDAVEDGSISYNKILRYFGKEIAEMVYCVTDELGRNRKERKAKTYEKLKENPDAIVIKVADRIANIEHGGKVDMYRKEHPDFMEALHPHSPQDAEDLWRHLERLIQWDK